MFKLFSGSAHSALSQEVALLLKIPLAKSEVVRFANSEVRVRIVDRVKNENCVVIQSTSNPTDANLMELFLFCDSLRRLEAQKVIGFIPYFGYARQDIQHRMGECVSANVVIRFLETIGFFKIYTIDLHDEATEGVFSIPFRNVSSLRILAENIKKYIRKYNIAINPKKIAIVSPDQGGIERARKFGRYFFRDGHFPLVVIEKERNLTHIHKSKTLDLYGDVKGKVAILVDDMVISGSTLVPAIELCLKKGAVKVLAAVTHHDFSPTAPRIIQNAKIEKLFTTNTIALKEEQEFAKLEEVSIAPLIVEELKSFI